MRALILIAASVLAGFVAAPVWSGAWPREPGSVFLAFSYEVVTSRRDLTAQGMAEDPTPDIDGYGSLYAEVGLTKRLTLGLDIGTDEREITAQLDRLIEDQARANGADSEEIAAGDQFDRDPPANYDGVVFLQYAFGTPGAPNQYAARLGVGLRSYELQGAFFGMESQEREAIFRPGLSYGRGFTSPLGPGWLALDLSAELRARTEGTPVKFDATLGLRSNERLAWILGLESGDFPRADPFVRLLPGAALTVRPGLTLTSSLIYAVEGRDEIGLKAGIWIEF